MTKNKDVKTTLFYNITILSYGIWYNVFSYFADVRTAAGRVTDDNQHERSGDPHGRIPPGHESSV